MSAQGPAPVKSSQSISITHSNELHASFAPELAPTTPRDFPSAGKTLPSGNLTAPPGNRVGCCVCCSVVAGGRCVATGWQRISAILRDLLNKLSFDF